MKKLLIVVDYQKDFVDGALGFPHAKDLDEGIAAKIREYHAMGEEGQVIFTMDTHDRHYMDSQEGKNLPVPPLPGRGGRLAALRYGGRRQRRNGSGVQ